MACPSVLGPAKPTSRHYARHLNAPPARRLGRWQRSALVDRNPASQTRAAGSPGSTRRKVRVQLLNGSWVVPANGSYRCEYEFVVLLPGDGFRIRPNLVGTRRASDY